MEIQDECVEHIHFKEGDSAEVMAIKFCEKHCLPEQFVAPLAEQIVSNIIPVRCLVEDILCSVMLELFSM